MFTHDTVERVKEAATSSRSSRPTRTCAAAGTRFTGLCPFHDERSPSFSVDPQAKLYHCFGCGVGGDVIKFVEEKEGLAFPEAVEALARSLRGRDRARGGGPAAPRRRAGARERLGRAAGAHGGLLSRLLRDSPKAAKARKYLEGRGLGAEVLEAFGVGCAPGTWDTVLIRGQQAGYSVEEIEARGAGAEEPEGRATTTASARGSSSRSATRAGACRGSARGRCCPDQKPKYLNSPEGELYPKRRTLYGIERARPRDREAAAGGRGRGLHGRARRAPGGDRGGGRDHGHGDHAGAGVAARRATPRRRCWRSTPTGPAARRCCAPSGGWEQERCGCASRDAARARTRPTCSRREARASIALRDAIDDAVRGLPVFHVRALLDDADLASPAGRDRALDEVVAVIAAMRGLDHARGADARGRRPARRRPRAGRAAGIASGGAGPTPATRARRARPRRSDRPPRSRRSLSARERRELALLAMCVRLPAEGRECSSGSRRSTSHRRSRPGRARWLRDHLEDPLEDCRATTRSLSPTSPRW